MAEDFVPTHRARVDEPPRVEIKIYDPAVGHVAVAPADAIESALDGRGGTLLQGQEKTPVPVFKGAAIIHYGGQVYATMPAGDVSAWFEPIPGDLKIPALPKKAGKTAVEELEGAK